MNDAVSSGPLAGVRILDLTSVIMGPVCTQILAGYGAEVIKVEAPEGDIMRHAGAKTEAGMGAMFLHSNRGKKSVVIDLKSATGRRQIAALLEDCDVFVHNIRPAAIARMGLDAGTVRRMRPDIVYAELTGYGVAGPYGNRPAFDDVIQAESGIAALFARQNSSEPAYLPALIADRLTGVTAAHRVLSALFERERTGRGSYVNVAMFETMAEFVLADHLGERTFDLAQGETGYNRLLTKYRRPYRTADGYIAVIVYNDKHWKSFFDVIHRPDIFASDERFHTAARRAESYDHIYGFVSRTLAGRSTSEWLEVLGRAQIPCAPVNAVADLLTDAHLQQTGFFHSHAGKNGQEWAASALPGVREARAPYLGEHSAACLPKQRPPQGENLQPDIEDQNTMQPAKIAIAPNGVATVTLQGGGPLNIISSATALGMAAQLRELAGNPGVRAVIIAGSGEKTFIGGADIKELARLRPDSARIFIRALHALCEAARDLPVPSICAIQGWCIGVGLELAASCDIRIAADTARFVMPEVKIAIPSVIQGALLSRLIGEGRARWMMLTGEHIDADRAERWGLVTQVVPATGLTAAAQHEAGALAELSPSGMRMQKRVLRTTEAPFLDVAMQHSIEIFGAAYESEDPGQVMAEFLAKKQSRS